MTEEKSWTDVQTKLNQMIGHGEPQSMEGIVASLKDLQDKIQQLERRLASSTEDQVKDLSVFKAPPITIYTNTPDAEQTALAASEFLKSKGVPADSIVHSKLTEKDQEIQNFLQNFQNQNGPPPPSGSPAPPSLTVTPKTIVIPSSEPPNTPPQPLITTCTTSPTLTTKPTAVPNHSSVYICFGNKLVVDFEGLQHTDFQSFFSNHPEEGEQMDLTPLESIVDTGISWVKSTFSWSLGKLGLLEEESVTKREGVDITVLHTNWYWRRLKRTMRFTPEGMLRIDPGTGEAKALRKYSQIQKLQLIDEHTLIIHYNDGSSPDFLQAIPSDIKRIILLILEHMPTPQK